MSTKKLEKLIQAPPSEVYYYFTNSTALKDWMCDIATADPQPGGRLYLCWPGEYYTSGEYIKLEQDKFVSFTWLGRGEPHQTHVEVSLKKKKSGTLIKLIHRGMGKSKKWLEISEGYEKEWHSAFENLASVLEEGPDLRITTRPMLGIYVDEFNPGIAKTLGVPVGQGLRLGGTIEGLGAQKAGLQTDDVIVDLDGHEITGAAAFGSFIRTKRAGDIVEVSFYRCTDKKTTKMLLTGRPIPLIPGSGLELSKQVKPVYEKFEIEIESVLNNSSEEECAYKPSQTEWSAKEILAHLIHNELGWQNVISEIIVGNEGAYDGFGGNIQARIDGTIETFPTKTDLMNELKSHDAETLSTLAHIPHEFLSHKGRFWKLVFLANQISYHLQTHLEQMRLAIQSAKNK